MIDIAREHLVKDCEDESRKSRIVYFRILALELAALRPSGEACSEIEDLFPCPLLIRSTDL